MPLTLVENDFRPIDGYPFQNWGARMGLPFDVMRPLSEDAAARAWQRTLPLLGGEPGAVLDLGATADWTVGGVRDWLLGQQGERDQVVIAVYHPQWAVAIEWGVLCDYWLTLLWAEAAVVGPERSWVLHHDGERFAYRDLRGAGE